MKFYLSKKRSQKRGQVLLGILISIAVFSILVHSVFTLVKLSYSFIGFSRARITARHLAQEKIELVRNLPYDNIGTLGGIPSGPLKQQENVQKNGLNYTVKTSIVFVDDPFDNQAPTDLLATDYKRIRVDISWEGLSASNNNPVTLVTDISPKGVETTVGGGTLSILVFNAQGQPVPQAEVHIAASSPSPAVDLKLKTNDSGRIILPGTPTCTDCYEITVTKEGYSSERTYSPDEVANPSKPHQTILEGDLTEVGFAIDKVGSINISSVNNTESGFTPLASVTFQMRGSKTIGTNTSGNPVYKYNTTHTTNSSGKLLLDDVEWDNYQIFMDSASPLDISGSNPFLPLVIYPDTTANFTFVLTPHTDNNLLIGFQDTSQNPIASVSAKLSDGIAYEKIEKSGLLDNPNYGQVFFPSLESRTYDIYATASGFLNHSGTLDVSGRSQQTIILTPE